MLGMWWLWDDIRCARLTMGREGFGVFLFSLPQSSEELQTALGSRA